MRSEKGSRKAEAHRPYRKNRLGILLFALTLFSAYGGGPTVQPAGGGRIAFMSDRDGNWEIDIMSADGSGLTRLV
jgi:Tol biopolymer transport system component